MDSGAKGIYCHTKFVQKHKLSREELQTPIFPTNVDGSKNQQGAITHATILQMEMGKKHQEDMEFLLTNTGNHNILLGTNWLKIYNPSIDWAKPHMTLSCCPPQCFQMNYVLVLVQLLPTLEWETQHDDHLDITSNIFNASQCMKERMNKFIYQPLIARTMVSTTIAKKAPKQITMIPPQFMKY